MVGDATARLWILRLLPELEGFAAAARVLHRPAVTDDGLRRRPDLDHRPLGVLKSSQAANAMGIATMAKKIQSKVIDPSGAVMSLVLASA
jgi:hypothetical protein